MDISLREWLIIGGVLVVVLILIDGWRRVNANRNRLRLEIDSRLSDLGEGDESHVNPELPNGGARRCAQEMMPGQEQASPTATASKGSSKRPERKEPVFSDSLNSTDTPTMDTSVQAKFSDMDPLFDDIPADTGDRRSTTASRKPAAETAETPPAPSSVAADPELLQAVEEGEIEGASLELDTATDDRPPRETSMELDFEQPIPILYDKVSPPDAVEQPEDTLAAYKRSLKQHRAEEKQNRTRRDPLQGLTATEVPIEPELSRFDRTELAVDESIPEAVTAEDSGDSPADSPVKTQEKPRLGLRNPPDPEHVLVITVVGRNNQLLPGPALHKIVTACGMEWGEMSLYHRSENDEPGAAVQFSMANAVAPGTFDPENLESLETPAVSFFMSMSEPDDPMNAYECMLATAETLAKHLDGDLLDENRSVMRPQTKEHYRERIREFLMHNRTRPVH